MKSSAVSVALLASMLNAVPAEAQAQCKSCEQCPGDPVLAWTNDHGGFWQALDPLHESRCLDDCRGDMRACHPSEEQEDLDVLAPALLAATLSVQSPDSLIWERGGIDAREEYAWASLVDAAFVGEEIWVVDVLSATVSRLSSDGTFIANVGGRGQGPGEFAQPHRIHWDGTWVSIFDPGLGRVARFGPDATVLARGIDSPPPSVGRLGSQYMLQGGVQVGETLMMAGPGSSDWVSHIVAWRRPGDAVGTAAVDTLGSPRALSVQGRFRPEVPPGPLPGRLGPSAALGVLGDSMVIVLDGMAATLRWLRPSEGELREVRRVQLPWSSRAMTDSDRYFALGAVEARVGPLMGDPEYPDRLPGGDMVEESPTGSVWVRKGGTGSVGQAEVWQEYSSTGDVGRSVTLPKTSRALAFGENVVLATRTDALGVVFLQLHRL